MITRWIVPITGFTQNLGEPNGFDKLWLQLRNLSRPDVSIFPPQNWKSSASHLAEFMLRNSDPALNQPDIVIVCYSWGFGHCGMNLCNQLLMRGLSVRHLVVSDGVFHSWRRPWRAMLPAHAPKWLPFWKQPAVKIPRNVKRVSWFRQDNDFPQGADLVAEDSDRTIIEPAVYCNGRSHVYMDDAPEFHVKAMEVCQVCGQ